MWSSASPENGYSHSHSHTSSMKSQLPPGVMPQAAKREKKQIGHAVGPVGQGWFQHARGGARRCAPSKFELQVAPWALGDLGGAPARMHRTLLTLHVLHTTDRGRGSDACVCWPFDSQIHSMHNNMLALPLGIFSFGSALKQARGSQLLAVLLAPL